MCRREDAGKAIGTGDTVGVRSCICIGVALSQFSRFQNLFLVPFAWCTLKPVAGVGTASASYCRLDQERSEVDFPLDISAGVSTLGNFRTRTYLTAETTLVPDGKWVFAEYHRNLMEKLKDMSS
ncbi:hypothetical protein TNCV_4330811 [Trichonephila clavipes]|nr:hypothetical protein TNCV_4330811 [Trichonephila clavipes]